MTAPAFKNLFNSFYLSVLLLTAGCSAKPEQVRTVAEEPVINFVALADFQAPAAEFSQVLLKIELLHSKADLLKHGISTPEEHQARLNYYRAQFKDDVYLLSARDSFPCYDVHAERMYMDLPYMNFILTFNHQLTTSDELLINDIIYSNKSVRVAIDPKMQLQ